MNYIKQLDSLRAFAVILVIVGHWFPEDHYLNFLPNGTIGVDLFFVLSGFLISGILFRNRNTSTKGTGAILKVFYARRTLRIFPIYYLTIIALYFLGPWTGTRIQEDFVYYLTYTSNFNFFMMGQWDGVISHLWSLAVEEQFYLVWPWVVLLLPRKYLIHGILVFISIGVGTRLLLHDLPLYRVFTTACFDSFGLGALLAWISVYKPNRLKVFYTGIGILGSLIVASMVFGFLVLSKSYWFVLPSGTINSVLALWVITYVYYHREASPWIFRWVLDRSWIILIGKISYGIYLYHHMIPRFTDLSRAWLTDIYPGLSGLFGLPYFSLVTNLAILFALSWFSFRWIEQPFLKLKKRFVVR